MTAETGWQDLSLGLFRRLRAELVRSVDGLDDAALLWAPSPGANPIGWLVWHVARAQDRDLSEVMAAEQLWLTDGWADHFHLPADARDTGHGHSPAQAAAFRAPGAADLLAYQAAVHDRAERYLADAPAGDPARVVTSPTLRDDHTVQKRLQGLLTDSLAHVGQIALLRGLLPGRLPARSGNRPSDIPHPSGPAAPNGLARPSSSRTSSRTVSRTSSRQRA
ncbi:DinB family protein [Streptomyces sp. NPDC088745]|uniref:DinB family protein n=1 Tax=Streptomyces sp. NPDC088745 TaxID=3365884 RepID=UPI00382A0DE4